jgi:hypothetical protein
MIKADCSKFSPKKYGPLPVSSPRFSLPEPVVFKKKHFFEIETMRQEDF